MRYYARFRGEQGYLRAVLRLGKVRKYITTDICVTSKQLARIESSGEVRVRTAPDKELSGKLEKCNKAIWGVITPLLEAGAFTSTPSDTLDREVREAYSGRKEGAL